MKPGSLLLSLTLSRPSTSYRPGEKSSPSSHVYRCPKQSTMNRRPCGLDIQGLSWTFPLEESADHGFQHVLEELPLTSLKHLSSTTLCQALPKALETQAGVGHREDAGNQLRY